MEWSVITHIEVDRSPGMVWVTIGYLKITIGNLKVTVGHPRVTIGQLGGNYGSP